MIIPLHRLTLAAVAMVPICMVMGGHTTEGQTRQGKGESQAQAQKGPGNDFPDLVGGLKKTKGCLGVETAQTSSGKNVIFAWFEDKQAVLRWYYSDTHRAAMRLAADLDQKSETPLEGVPDDVGPVLAIASITFAKEPKFKNLNLPISQISIELYKPLTGGIFLGSRFAPESLNVPGMKDYTPKDEKPE
jgi:heme-degrading monooxygenase HmoA